MPGRTRARRFRIHIRISRVCIRVWWVQTIAARIFMAGPRSLAVLCVTREWKSRADLHGTEGIEFHDGCFFILLSGVCAAIGWNLNNKSRQIVNGAACARVCSR
jgi:hypothetical protein